MTEPGLVVVDKPGGITSHGVVGRVRRLVGTRKVGHAGTLDPMATGVLVLGVGRATRLLGHLMLTDKAYEATVRLGVSTTTDDAEGEVVSDVPASGLDPDAAAKVETMLHERLADGAAIMLVTHDTKQAQGMASKHLRMEAGALTPLPGPGDVQGAGG